jgi:hypothetical protein
MNRPIRFLMLIVMTIILLVAVQAAQPVAAEGALWESNWRVDVDFEDDHPNVFLTVQVWAVGAGFYAEETTELKCYASPTVGFAEEKAVFTGVGGIRCAMPDMAAIVYALTDVPEAPAPPFVLPDECDCKKGAYATAELDLDENNTNQDWANPVFYLTDMALDTPIDAGMGKRPFMTFNVDGSASSSDIFYGVKAETFARFLPQLGMPDMYDVLFTAQGMILDATPENINQTLAISTEQTVLYIGFSPVTGESMRGRLNSLTIDPGCFGVD